MVKSLAIYIFAILCWLASLPAEAVNTLTFIPEGARTYAPVLVEKQETLWPEAEEPWTLGGLVEQESCVSLTNKRCWNPKAELKTSREYGFGFGQITVAYRADGVERFNKFTELKRAHASLRDWEWEERYDPGYQLTAVVEMVHVLFDRIRDAQEPTDHWAFTLSGYNGGLGAVLQDRRLCANTDGCDPGRWFGNVAETSLKSKVPQPAYAGRSWFEINRNHVKNILTLRRDKYAKFWECQTGEAG